MRNLKSKLGLAAVVLSISSALPAQAQHAPRGTFEDLNGIVAAFRCSGVLVSLGQADSEPGLILSAGHCSVKGADAKYPPYTARVNDSLTIEDEYASYYKMDGSILTMGSFKLRSVVYGTMTYEDVTLFSTVPTLGELKKLGVKIYKIADQLPSVGQKLQVTSGLWGQTQLCSVDAIITDNGAEKAIAGRSLAPLEMKNSILLNEECAARSGWSGSPLISPTNGLVYGVISRMGITPTSGGSPRVIASGLDEVKKCFSLKGKLNLPSYDCKLPRSN